MLYNALFVVIMHFILMLICLLCFYDTATDIPAIAYYSSWRNESQEAWLRTVDASPAASTGTSWTCQTLRSVQVVRNSWSGRREFGSELTQGSQKGHKASSLSIISQKGTSLLSILVILDSSILSFKMVCEYTVYRHTFLSFIPIKLKKFRRVTF